MKSAKTARFQKTFDRLPERVQNSANIAYKLWKENPWHSSLQFKQIHLTKPIYSVRISLSYRALGVKENDTMIWFWIGSHSEYDKLIAGL